MNRRQINVLVFGAEAYRRVTYDFTLAAAATQTENALLARPFKAAYMLRAGIIQPKSKTRSYRLFYSAFAFVLPLLRAALPNHVSTTQRMGLAMIGLATQGYDKRILETRDIEIVAQRASSAAAAQYEDQWGVAEHSGQCSGVALSMSLSKSVSSWASS